MSLAAGEMGDVEVATDAVLAAASFAGAETMAVRVMVDVRPEGSVRT